MLNVVKDGLYLFKGVALKLCGLLLGGYAGLVKNALAVFLSVGMV